jgi:hypothetical protein
MQSMAIDLIESAKLTRVEAVSRSLRRSFTALEAMMATAKFSLDPGVADLFQNRFNKVIKNTS